jgi:hypothetical protein
MDEVNLYNGWPDNPRLRKLFAPYTTNHLYSLDLITTDHAIEALSTFLTTGQDAWSAIIGQLIPSKSR